MNDADERLAEIRARAEAGYLARADLMFLLSMVEAQRKQIEAVRKYVEDPGNWSALDGRRQLLLHMLGASE